MNKMMQDPQMMAMLRNPKMQEVMKAVMSGGPEAAEPLLKDDPELREMLAKVSAMTGEK